MTRGENTMMRIDSGRIVCSSTEFAFFLGQRKGTKQMDTANPYYIFLLGVSFLTCYINTDRN